MSYQASLAPVTVFAYYLGKLIKNQPDRHTFTEGALSAWERQKHSLAF